MNDALKAAIFRFVAAFFALGIAILIVLYVPDPTLKPLGATLAAAAILGLEELLKTRAGV